MAGFCFPARLLSHIRNLPLSPPHERIRKVLDSSLEAAMLVFEGRCVCGWRINRINATSTAAGLTPSRNAKSSTFQGSFVLLFEELMKSNRVWRLQDTAGAAMRLARLLWSEPPPS